MLPRRSRRPKTMISHTDRRGVIEMREILNALLLGADIFWWLRK